MIIFLLPHSSSFSISELAITDCYTSLRYILVNFKRCLQSSTKLKNLCVFIKYVNYFVLLVIIPVLYVRMFSFFDLFVCLLFLLFILLHVKKFYSQNLFCSTLMYFLIIIDDTIKWIKLSKGPVHIIKNI